MKNLIYRLLKNQKIQKPLSYYSIQNYGVSSYSINTQLNSQNLSNVDLLSLGAQAYQKHSYHTSYQRQQESSSVQQVGSKIIQFPLEQPTVPIIQKEPLISQINQANTLQQLEQLYQNQAEEFDAVRMTAFLERIELMQNIASFKTQTFGIARRLVAKAYPRILDNLKDMNITQLIQAYILLQKLKVLNQESSAEIFTRIQTEIHSATASDIANILKAIASLKSPDKGKKYIILPHIQKVLDTGEFPDVVTATYSLGPLGIKDDKLAKSVTQRLLQDFYKLDVIMVSQSLMGLSRMGYYDETFYDACLAKFRAYSDVIKFRDMERIFYAFGKVDQKLLPEDFEMFLKVLIEVIEDLRTDEFLRCLYCMYKQGYKVPFDGPLAIKIEERGSHIMTFISHHLIKAQIIACVKQLDLDTLTLETAFNEEGYDYGAIMEDMKYQIMDPYDLYTQLEGYKFEDSIPQSALERVERKKPNLLSYIGRRDQYRKAYGVNVGEHIFIPPQVKKYEGTEKPHERIKNTRPVQKIRYSRSQ